MVQQTEIVGESIGQPRSERTQETAAADQRGRLRSTPGFYRRAWRRLRRDKVAMVSLGICVFILLFAFGAPVVSQITGHSYERGDLRSNLLAPGSDSYLLGTDASGRDILTRLAYGGRISLMVAWLSALVALAVGGTVGSVAGYYGGFIDSVLMRFVDMIIAIPGITLLLLLSTLWRPGPVGLALVIASLGWTGIARLVRGEVLSLKNRDYVDAARVVGASNSRIIFRHIFPNVLSLIIVWISLAIPGLIIAEASLSYLGFGVRIPIPSWGNMLDEAKEFYRASWTYVFIPGLAIYITALAFNLLGNGLRDALDPRLND
ncbi:MAG: ABC transporter permease [Chloroflexia bacterium]|nr:ABC transporter permease [Chloroflexia bacterium]